jgi:hypothetical protein
VRRRVLDRRDRREDDNEHALGERLRLHRENIDAVLELFVRKEHVITVDAGQGIDAVQREIRRRRGRSVPGGAVPGTEDRRGLTTPPRETGLMWSCLTGRTARRSAGGETRVATPRPPARCRRGHGGSWPRSYTVPEDIVNKTSRNALFSEGQAWDLLIGAGATGLGTAPP